MFVLAHCLEDLISEWKRFGIGVKFGNYVYNVLAYADDIVLIGKSLSEATFMVKQLRNRLNQYGLDFDDALDRDGRTKNHLLMMRCFEENGSTQKDFMMEMAGILVMNA